MKVRAAGSRATAASTQETKGITGARGSLGARGIPRLVTIDSPARDADDILLRLGWARKPDGSWIRPESVPKFLPGSPFPAV